MELDIVVKSVIEAVTCPVHHAHPQIITREDNTSRLICCCPEFKVQCYHLLKKVLDEVLIRQCELAK